LTDNGRPLLPLTEDEGNVTMAKGTISKLVHLSLQSANSADCSSAVKGYGYVKADDAKQDDPPIYFEAKNVEGYSFDDLQVGQTVEFDPDPKSAVAKKVRLIGEVLDAPSPRVNLS
jgi:cold shock CspA family protein